MSIKIDTNSTENQKIKGDFVSREVKACFSYEMDAILQASSVVSHPGQTELPDYEDIENMYLPKCSECGYQGSFERVADDTRMASNDFFVCPDCRYEHAEEPETEPQEVLEWWIVSEFLYNKLKKKQEPVLEWGNNYYWGRTCSGQAILLDGVISSICREMEILNGQKYSWSK